MKTTLALLTALVAAGLAHGAIKYDITDLGPSAPGDSFGLAINSTGQVAGYSTPANTRAFRYTVGGSMVGLTSPGTGDASIGNAINDSGVVVGNTNTSPGGKRVAAVATGNALVPLGTLGGLTGNALGINNGGTIVGTSTIDATANSPTHAFYTTKSGSTYTLHDIAGGPRESIATAINNSGWIVGQYRFMEGLPYVAFLYISVGQPGAQLTPLYTLPGGTTSGASAINTKGDIVGYSEVKIGQGIFGQIQTHAFCLPTKDTGMGGFTLNDLGVFPGGSYTYARGINDSGLIVGFGDVVSNGMVTTHPFITTSPSRVGLSDLNNYIDPESGWELNYAYAINNAGQITGQGLNPEGKFHAFLLTRRVTPTGYPHPADTSYEIDGDYNLSLSEATAYRTAFKKGEKWPTAEGEEIDISYAVKSRLILLKGGWYTVDPTQNPPDKWAPDPDHP